MAKILSFAAYERALTALLGMQHTALCGILPGEEMIDVINTMRNACRKLFPERQYSRPPVLEVEKICFLTTIVYI